MDELSELQVACLIRVIGKPDLDDFIVYGCNAFLVAIGFMALGTALKGFKQLLFRFKLSR